MTRVSRGIYVGVSSVKVATRFPRDSMPRRFSKMGSWNRSKGEEVSEESYRKEGPRLVEEPESGEMEELLTACP